MDDLFSLTDDELLQEATEQGVDIAAVGSAGREAFKRAQVLVGRKRLASVGREIAEDAGRAPPAYDQAKARSRLGPILAEYRKAMSKLKKVGGEGATPKFAYQGRVHGAGMPQFTEPARDPRYNSDDNRRRISWITATAIVVADTIGVGVFTSLGFPPWGDLLCGARCYAASVERRV